MPDITLWTETLDRNHALLTRHAEGVTHQQALQPIAPGRSHLNWMIGHVVVSRDAMLSASGADRLADADVVEVYDYGTRAPSVDTAVPHEVLLDLMARQGVRLAEIWESLDDEAFAAASGMGDADVARQLTFMVWHETYHMGQAALYRAALGLDGVIG